MTTMTDNHIFPKKLETTKGNIVACWGIIEDIRLLNSAVQDKEIDRDSIANILLGLEYLYELKFQKLMETHNEELKGTRT